MTDQELLELAAKAVQLPERGWMGPAFMYVKDNTFTEWNPLTDDGDALRLAVKLRLNIEQEHIGSAVMAGDTSREKYIDHADECAATRRAIVRAAAEIGRLKQ